jgi:hypothetical protein
MKTYPYTGLGLDIRHHGPPRTPGIHLASIVRHIALRTGILAKEYGTGPTLNELIHAMDPVDVGKCGPLMKCIVGYAWESWLSKQLAARNPRYIPSPGEITRDDIIGTPDGVESIPAWLGGGGIIHEIKATWKTSTRPIHEEIMWMMQGMAYCWMMEGTLEEPWRTAIFHPIYLSGDYRQHRDPVYSPMVCEFEKEELEMNWQLIMNNKYDVIPEVG